MQKFGCGISFPAHKRAAGIKKDILEAIAKGELNPGEECCRRVIATYTLSEGELARKEVEVHGRKIPLQQLRKALLKQHEAKGLMRPVPQVLEDYTSIPRNMVIKRLRAIGEYQDNGHLQTDEELQTHLFICQSQRLLLLQSDHADVLGRSYIMEVLKVIYDSAIHLTDEEFEAEHGHRINVQAAVEAPMIRLFAISGSSEDDYLHVVQDRTSDLDALSGTLERADGSTLVDKLVAFNGDLQMRWAEAGLQKGGGYRCRSGCGLTSSLFPSYASTLLSKIPSYEELRQRAIEGTYGRIPGRNLHALSTAEARVELRRRHIRISRSADAKAIQVQLKENLAGVQRVPALLAFAPTTPLAQFGLER